MNINEEIQKATDKIIAEKLPILIEEKVTKMLDEILSDTFKSWSSVGKQVKEKIEQNLDINLQKYDMISYNALVSKAINDRLVGLVNENAIEPIMELVKDTIGYVNKKEIKLSEIQEMFVDSSMSENEEEGEGEISFYVEENEKNKWFTVYADIDKNVDKEKCSIEFLISKDNGKIFLFKTNSYWSKKGVITPTKLTHLSHLEAKIYRLYSAQVKIEIDHADFENENYWSRY